MTARLSPSPAAGPAFAGLLGAALQANQAGRLARFIRDESSPAIALFCPACAHRNLEGDWYGEHAGKWLQAAARAARRTGDAVLTAQVRRVADYLVSVQEPDGYLGTYAPERRFMCRVAPGPPTWDGAPGRRTWDVWVHSYLVLGLLEVHRSFPAPGYLAAAQKIGDLFWRTLRAGEINVTDLGNHHGLSATVLMDPAMELHFATGEPRYLALAELVLRQANERPDLALLPRTLEGTDAAFVATGKAYQLLWNLVGLVKLHRATRSAPLLEAAQALWTSVRDHHLTLGGGPWGGVAARSRETFNPPGVFSPRGYVETCSILAWIQLNRALLELTGEARYAEAIEVAAYNDLLGAQDPAGEDWCYYSFPNGRRVYTTYWRCCKSSGALALEELPLAAYSLTAADEVSINLYGPGRATLATDRGGVVGLEQVTDYPFAGVIRVQVQPERPAVFAVRLRIPSWAAGATVAVNGVAPDALIAPGDYWRVERRWQSGDEIQLNFPLSPQLHLQTHRNVQESRAPDGTLVRQEVLREDYAAITRGPLVYATGLIDGFKREETLRLPAALLEEHLEVTAPPAGFAGPGIRLHLGYRPPLLFQPYFEAGGRRDGAWRLTWLPVAAGEEDSSGGAASGVQQGAR